MITAAGPPLQLLLGEPDGSFADLGPGALAAGMGTAAVPPTLAAVGRGAEPAPAPEPRDARGFRRAVPAEAVLEYYQACWNERLWAGHHPRSHDIHCGLHAGDDDDPEAARLRLDEHLATVAGLGSEPARLLDAGCGVGGTALLLAGRHPALEVVGVNVSWEQVWLARHLAHATGLDDRVSFLARSYLYTGLEAESFDVVLAVESLGHCDARADFAREAFRLLRPGGVLVVADEVLVPRPLDGLETACYAALLRGFVYADCFASPPAEVFGAAGFVEPWREDLTAKVLPGMRRARDRAAALLPTTALSDPERRHLRACVALHALCQGGVLRYVVFRARKPPRQGGLP